MSRRDEVDQVAAQIVRDLASGKWRHVVGLGGWDATRGVRGDALNLLLDEERIEHDTGRDVFRLVRVAPARQTTIYEEAP